MAEILIKHLQQAEKIIRTASAYNQATYGSTTECGCVLGAIAAATGNVDEQDGKRFGGMVVNMLRHSPLRSFRVTLRNLEDCHANIDKSKALTIIRRFIAALRRHIHAAH